MQNWSKCKIIFISRDFVCALVLFVEKKADKLLLWLVFHLLQPKLKFWVSSFSLAGIRDCRNTTIEYRRTCFRYIPVGVCLLSLQWKFILIKNKNNRFIRFNCLHLFAWMPSFSLDNRSGIKNLELSLWNILWLWTVIIIYGAVRLIQGIMCLNCN